MSLQHVTICRGFSATFFLGSVWQTVENVFGSSSRVRNPKILSVSLSGCQMKTSRFSNWSFYLLLYNWLTTCHQWWSFGFCPQWTKCSESALNCCYWCPRGPRVSGTVAVNLWWHFLFFFPPLGKIVMVFGNVFFFNHRWCWECTALKIWGALKLIVNDLSFLVCKIYADVVS